MTPGALPDPGGQAAAVRTAWDSLPAADQEIIALAHFRHLSMRQIAHHTGMSLDTVQRRTTAALRSMRDALDGAG